MRNMCVYVFCFWVFISVFSTTIFSTVYSGQSKAPGRRPPPGSHQVDVPEHPFDIIVCRPARNSVILNVLTYSDARGYIEYGTKQGIYEAKSITYQFENGEPQSIILDSLLPDTKYYYRFFYQYEGSSGLAASDEYAFNTQRAKGKTFVFTIQADSHLDPNINTEIYRTTLSNANKDRPDFHIALGDTFMAGKFRGGYKDSIRQYIAQRYYFGLLCHSSAFYFALGNHDGESGGSFVRGAESRPVWAANTRKAFFPNPYPDSFYTGNNQKQENVGFLEDYYAWEWGDGLFIVLDPFWYSKVVRGEGDGNNWYWTLGEVQYKWLKKTLEESNAKFKFLFMHHLIGGLNKSGVARGGAEAAKYFEWGGNNLDGSYGFDKQRPGWDMPIHDMLVKNNASAVFHGHDHLFVKQDLDGIVYHLVPWAGNYKDPRGDFELFGYYDGDMLDSGGYLRVTVSSDKAVVDYIRSILPKDEERLRVRNGDNVYSYTIRSD